jgi:hypothetical protein
MRTVKSYMSVDFTGTWNADLSKSRLLGPTPKALSVNIEHSDSELQEEMLVTNIDGSEDRVLFKCGINKGKHECLLNGRVVRGGARWEGEELVIELWVQIGTREMHFRDCWSLSVNGQTLSMEHRDDDLAGQITVFERAE